MTDSVDLTIASDEEDTARGVKRKHLGAAGTNASVPKRSRASSLERVVNEIMDAQEDALAISLKQVRELAEQRMAVSLEGRKVDIRRLVQAHIARHTPEAQVSVLRVPAPDVQAINPPAPTGRVKVFLAQVWVRDVNDSRPCAVAACEDNDAALKVWRCPACTTWICLSCMKSHVLEKLATGATISCPSGQCSSIVDAAALPLFEDDPLELFRHQATVVLRHPLQQQEIDYAVSVWKNSLAQSVRVVGHYAMLPDQNAVTNALMFAQLKLATRKKGAKLSQAHPPRPCTAPRCNGYVVATQPMCVPDGKGSCSCPPMKCGDCGADLCPRCDTPHAAGVQCDKEALATMKKIRSTCSMCPSCGTAVQKVSGCDHMFCTACATFFNYRTGEAIPQAVPNPEHHDFSTAQARPHLKAGDVSLDDLWDVIPVELQERLGGFTFLSHNRSAAGFTEAHPYNSNFNTADFVVKLLAAGVDEPNLRTVLLEGLALHLARGYHHQHVGVLLQEWADANIQCALNPESRSYQGFEAQRAFAADKLASFKQPPHHLPPAILAIFIDRQAFDTAEAASILAPFVRGPTGRAVQPAAPAAAPIMRFPTDIAQLTQFMMRFMG